ncbi:MAG: YggT family protein [Anaerolineales bacterium]|nr:YggT family protein [Anaerolineales bacterium]
MTNDNRVSQVKVTQREPERERRIFSFKATQVVWLLFGFLITMIALRIGLKLIGANPLSPIVTLIYGFTDIFLFPFTGLINSPSTGNIVLELSSFFAILIYGLIAWGIERVIWLIFYRPRGPVVDVTETTTSEHHSN